MPPEDCHTPSMQGVSLRQPSVLDCCVTPTGFLMKQSDMDEEGIAVMKQTILREISNIEGYKVTTMLRGANICCKVTLAALHACGAIRARTGAARLVPRNFLVDDEKFVPSFAPLERGERLQPFLAAVKEPLGHPVEDPAELKWATENSMKPLCPPLHLFL
jgi:hypothetical protein